MALAEKNILLGVSGGIAAYKAAELIRLLVARQARVQVMMTPNAAQFITPLTLQTLSGKPVASQTFDLGQESQIGHIRLADSADLIVIAPATADIIAKAALGIADDLVTTVLLAAHCPVAFAPAMNVHMYAHPAVKENLARLVSRGVTVIEPTVGPLACGYEGQGRLCEPTTIVEEAERLLTPADLAGQRLLISAGPTQESIDPVRFVSNRSSGKMGYALARAAWMRGAEVRLISGPTALPVPGSVTRISTVSAEEMLRATSDNFAWCTVLVMAAAIADFRPATVATQKIKKRAARWRLELEPIADQLPALAARKGTRRIIGFAAETEELLANAQAKLQRKKLDLIVANDVTAEGAGFAVDTNIVTLIDPSGRVEPHPKLSKDEVANLILDRVAKMKAETAQHRADAVRALSR
ncbi:MAG TPA: bifunctional phosphopantothenoylcysteine decarboxylase/phosphopantothenate--cysteine ligase CoaBC [Candidatus Binataceae bacterium]|nr:bifunctional phosphopantothenoylcysteine decarboxylase/phosphopantothenate--cysteine ligase CoaBC [Candidatus Binataceae bacterium]